MSLFIRGNVSDEGAVNHVTQQDPQPHESDPRMVIAYAFGGAVLCLLSIAGAALLMWGGG